MAVDASVTLFSFVPRGKESKDKKWRPDPEPYPEPDPELEDQNVVVSFARGHKDHNDPSGAGGYNVAQDFRHSYTFGTHSREIKDVPPAHSYSDS